VEVVVEGFERFVQARWGALLRTAYVLTGDRHLAEDLLQDALSRTAERWPGLAESGNAEAYVRRCLYNGAVDGWRRRARRPEVLGGDAVVDTAPHRAGQPGAGRDAVVETDARVVLRRALDQLTARQRAVLVLRYYEDLTEAQAAEVLGCSVNTVKSQTRKALDRLRAVAPDLSEAFTGKAVAP
jgi:RNA polymerase sigma-70 factor (sigma-E family)